MTHYPGSEELPRDPLVRGVYRELASERTPKALDDAVLAHARSNVKAPRGSGSGLGRPLAWAATVGLCLAIVLQTSLDPPAGERHVPTSGPTPADLHETAVELRARKLGETHREKSAPAAVFTDDAIVAPTCSADQREARDKWLRCIDALEAAGHADLAAAERARLQAVHPHPEKSGTPDD